MVELIVMVIDDGDNKHRCTVVAFRPRTVRRVNARAMIMRSGVDE